MPINIGSRNLAQAALPGWTMVGLGPGMVKPISSQMEQRSYAALMR
jgi:hypothetical protein